MLSRRYFQFSEVFELDLMPLRATAIFCFTASTGAKQFPLRTFLTEEREEKAAWVRLGE